MWTCLKLDLLRFSIQTTEKLFRPMPNVTFDSNTVFGARDSRPEVGIFVRSAGIVSYKHDKHASITIINKFIVIRYIDLASTNFLYHFH